MAPFAAREEQRAFAASVAALLRQSRKGQHLTQLDVANRTGGLVSKPALANYETGQRSLRVDVFWVIAKALDEDPGAILATAGRVSGIGGDARVSPMTVRIDAIERSSDSRLDAVRRWLTLRGRTRGTADVSARYLTLDARAVDALAELMGVSASECRAILAEVSVGAEAPSEPGGASTSLVTQRGSAAMEHHEPGGPILELRVR